MKKHYNPSEPTKISAFNGWANAFAIAFFSVIIVVAFLPVLLVAGALCVGLVGPAYADTALPIGEYGNVPEEGRNGGETTLWVKGPDKETPATGSASSSGGAGAPDGRLAKTSDFVSYVLPMGILLACEACVYASLVSRESSSEDGK